MTVKEARGRNTRTAEKQCDDERCWTLLRATIWQAGHDKTQSGETMRRRPMLDTATGDSLTDKEARCRNTRTAEKQCDDERCCTLLRATVWQLGHETTQSREAVRRRPMLDTTTGDGLTDKPPPLPPCLPPSPCHPFLPSPQPNITSLVKSGFLGSYAPDR
jgi:hypothetical protein